VETVLVGHLGHLGQLPPVVTDFPFFTRLSIWMPLIVTVSVSPAIKLSRRCVPCTT
jgi:hypothetical protein